MHIRILSASDRNNYGDLLFALVIFNYLKANKNEYKIKNYAIFDSNLQEFGALPTYSLKTLASDVKKEKGANQKIIIAGGEVIGGNWLNILRYSKSFWQFVQKNKILRGIFSKTGLLDKYFENYFSSSKPFILDGPVFYSTEIVYNSVGANGSKRILSENKYREYFRRVRILSVRDYSSKNKFDKHKIEAELVPDSALVMSDLLSGDIQGNISDRCLSFSRKPYLFLQFGNNKGPDNLSEFITKLREFANINGLQVLLCPIGLALDHDDEIILKSIKINADDFIYYRPKNLYETMHLIKNTAIYLGTSLHGMITAQSFNRPYFVFDEKVHKNEQYIDTWKPSESLCYGSFFDFDLIQKRIDDFNEEGERSRTSEQKKLIYNNFKTIFADVS